MFEGEAETLQWPPRPKALQGNTQTVLFLKNYRVYSVYLCYKNQNNCAVLFDLDSAPRSPGRSRLVTYIVFRQSPVQCSYRDPDTHGSPHCGIRSWQSCCGRTSQRVCRFFTSSRNASALVCGIPRCSFRHNMLSSVYRCLAGPFDVQNQRIYVGIIIQVWIGTVLFAHPP